MSSTAGKHFGGGFGGPFGPELEEEDQQDRVITGPPANKINARRRDRTIRPKRAVAAVEG